MTKEQIANQQWWDNFRGRCISCNHATQTERKGEMLCQLEKAARNHGMPSRPGGTWMGTTVSPLYGCVYFESIRALPQ